MSIPSCASPIFAAVRMGITLRTVQLDVCNRVFDAWENGFDNVLMMLPTGAGKTVCVGYIVSKWASTKWAGAICAQAHRQELVGQISLALARFGIRHKVLAPDGIISNIIALHVRKLGTSFIQPTSDIAVGGVDTIIRKGKLISDAWCRKVTLVIPDEGHHVLRGNKWGRAVDVFTNPMRKMLTPTATPERPDGKGVGKWASGYIDKIVEGPGLRWHIDNGYLVDYRVALPKCDIEFTKEMFSKTTGELNEKGKAAVRGSHLIGDVVKEYQRLSPGKPAVAFVDLVEDSTSLAENFRKAGVRAMHVDGDTKDDVREDAVRKLENGQIEVLSNVDLFGEGFDLPSIFAVYDASATESFIRYTQRFGRPLRLDIAPELMAVWDDFTVAERKAHIAASRKPWALYVDMVGNIVRHQGTPDRPRPYSLDDREKRGDSNGSGVPQLTVCTNPDNKFKTGFACMNIYERWRTCCPECGFTPSIKSPSIETLEGDFTLLDSETLNRLFDGVIDVDGKFEHRYGQTVVSMAMAKNDRNIKDAQRNLRDAMAWWAGDQTALGLNDREIYKRFFLTFKTDWLGAMSLNAKDAKALATEIDKMLTVSSLLARVESEHYISPE